MKYQARSAYVFLAALLFTLPAATARADTGDPEGPLDPTQIDPSGLDRGFANDQDVIGQSRGRRSRARRSRARARRRARVRRRASSRRRARAQRRAEARRVEHEDGYDRYDEYDDVDFEDERRSRSRSRSRREERTRRRSEERERRRSERRERRERREQAERYPAGHRSPPALDVLVGARIQGRLARFETIEGNVHHNEVAYPLLTAAIIGRPFSGASGVERGLTIRGFFGHAVGLRSRNTLTDEAVDTSFFSFYVDGAVLFEVHPSAQVGLGLGIGYDSYSFGEQMLVVVPSAEYPYVRPHLRGRFLLEDELAVLTIDLAYRGVFARGALSEHFGQDGQTQGFDITGRLSGNLDIGISYALEAGFQGYFHFFDGDALTTPARSGTDLGLWLGAQVGFAIR